MAHAFDYDFRLVPPSVIAPLQHLLEGGLRSTMSVLLGCPITESAWERPTCYGGLGVRVAQIGVTAQATFWSAVDLLLAVMLRICEALGRPIVGDHPDGAIPQSLKTELLDAGVVVDLYAKIHKEFDAKEAYAKSPWARDKVAEEIVKPTLAENE